VEPEDGFEDEGPFSAWLPPDDRLWRHPSELGGDASRNVDPTQDLSAFEGIGSGDNDVTKDFDARLQATHGGVATQLRTGPVRNWAVAVVAGVVGALLASGVSMATREFGSRAPIVQTTASVSTPNTVAAPDTVDLALPESSSGMAASPNWTSIASAIAASVVGLVASNGTAGSGILYAEGNGRSYILTTSDLATQQVHVTYDDGEQQSGKLVSSDPSSGLAIVSVSGQQRAIPTFGSVSDLREAEPVLAVTGGQPEVTDAPLSVTSVDDSTTLSDSQTLVNALAVTGTAPTIEGGALVDSQGRVVGITTSMTSTDPMQQGTSYAIPINVAVHVADQMMRKKHVTHPFLGVLQSQDLSSITARAMGVSGGATVETVAPGSPAAAAGISAGDVITAMGSSRVTSAGGLTTALCRLNPGVSVHIHYLHKGKPATATLRISEQPGSVNDPDAF
jgi:S1-C subfamily serine protease